MLFFTDDLIESLDDRKESLDKLLKYSKVFRSRTYTEKMDYVSIDQQQVESNFFLKMQVLRVSK